MEGLLTGKDVLLIRHGPDKRGWLSLHGNIFLVELDDVGEVGADEEKGGSLRACLLLCWPLRVTTTAMIDMAGDDGGGICNTNDGVRTSS